MGTLDLGPGLSYPILMSQPPADMPSETPADEETTVIEEATPRPARALDPSGNTSPLIQQLQGRLSQYHFIYSGTSPEQATIAPRLAALVFDLLFITSLAGLLVLALQTPQYFKIIQAATILGGGAWLYFFAGHLITKTTLGEWLCDLQLTHQAPRPLFVSLVVRQVLVSFEYLLLPVAGHFMTRPPYQLGTDRLLGFTLTHHPRSVGQAGATILPATPNQRLVAGLIDLGLWLVPLALSSQALTRDPARLTGIAFWLALVCYPLGILVGEVLTRQTPGTWLCGLVITSACPRTRAPIILRRLISWLTAGVAYPLWLMDKESRGPAEIMTATVIGHEKRSRPGAVVLAIALAWLLILVGLMVAQRLSPSRYVASPPQRVLPGDQIAPQPPSGGDKIPTHILFPKTSLKIHWAGFVDSATGKPLSPARYSPGATMKLTMGILGFALNAEGQSDLDFELKIFQPDGRLIEQKPHVARLQTAPVSTTALATLELEIKTDALLIGGRYRLVITVFDRIAGTQIIGQRIFAIAN